MKTLKPVCQLNSARRKSKIENKVIRFLILHLPDKLNIAALD